MSSTAERESAQVAQVWHFAGEEVAGFSGADFVWCDAQGSERARVPTATRR